MPTRPWNEWGALVLLGLNKCFLVPLLPCEPQQEPGSPFPLGWAVQLRREDAWAGLCSPRRAGSGRLGVQRAGGCFSPLLSECFSPVKPRWAVGAPLAGLCPAQAVPPVVPRTAELLLGVTALCLLLPPKAGGGVSAGPGGFRTLIPVSSLSLVPLGNADLLLISVIQPHWH